MVGLGPHPGRPPPEAPAWVQVIELRPVADRFLRLLEILGQWYEKGKVLIFVKGQGECDDLFRDLLKARRPHGRAAPH